MAWQRELTWATVSAFAGAAVGAALTVLVFSPAEEAREIAADIRRDVRNEMEADRTDQRAIALQEIDAVSSLLLLAEVSGDVCALAVAVPASSEGRSSSGALAEADRKEDLLDEARSLRSEAWSEVVSSEDFELARELISQARAAFTSACLDDPGVDSNGGPPGGGVLGDVEISVRIEHTYRGDLVIELVSPECSETLFDVDDDATDDVDETFELVGCRDFYPPAQDGEWFVRVTDTASADTGVVEEVTVRGPDGGIYRGRGLPVDIPDDGEVTIVIGR